MEKMIRRVWMLALCAVLFCCGCASAESGINLGGAGCDEMKYACTLPDGRMVFCGSRGTVGNYNESRARLLCLNPDWSVSWEFFDSVEGMGRYTWGALLADGNIGVIYTNAPYQEPIAMNLQKFTTEGERAGKMVDIFHLTQSPPDPVNALCVPIDYYTPEGTYMRGFLDWDGNLLFGMKKNETIGYGPVLAAGDGLVLAGSEPGLQGNAKIMKVDLQGNTVWETVLPLFNGFAQKSRIVECVQTPDGGYLGWIMESGNDTGNGQMKWGCALVRFSAEGRVLWTNTESFANQGNIRCRSMAERNGKVVFLEEGDDVSEKTPVVCRWFDGNGKETGRTELRIPREDAGATSDAQEIQIYGGDLIATDTGFRAMFSLRIADDYDIRKEMDTVDDVVYRIPEPVL